jgi:hypothetical protein
VITSTRLETRRTSVMHRFGIDRGRGHRVERVSRESLLAGVVGVGGSLGRRLMSAAARCRSRHRGAPLLGIRDVFRVQKLAASAMAVGQRANPAGRQMDAGARTGLGQRRVDGDIVGIEPFGHGLSSTISGAPQPTGVSSSRLDTPLWYFGIDLSGIALSGGPQAILPNLG